MRTSWVHCKSHIITEHYRALDDVPHFIIIIHLDKCIPLRRDNKPEAQLIDKLRLQFSVQDLKRFGIKSFYVSVQ